MVEAKIQEVYYCNLAGEETELSTEKAEAPLLDGYLFHQNPKIASRITMSKDPSDGGYYALLIGLFIDGIEAQFTTGWLRNDSDQRTREYAFEIPKHPVKLMSSNKVHTAQIKIGQRRVVWGIPLPTWISRTYDLEESDVFYYKNGKTPE
jgi:hypothetical protein